MENIVIESEKGLRKYEKQDLSARERAFIKAFTEIGAETYGLAQEAALKAGYVEAQVEHTARRLMQNPRVLLAIDEVYASRMDNTPTNVARILSNLDNCEALALKVKSMPTLTKIAELKGKYLDIFSSNSAAATSEDAAKRLARMSDEQKRICELIARILTSKGDNSKDEAKLKQLLLDNPEIEFSKQPIKT